MTSLIDVIFLLLLFFMLSSTFTRFGEVALASGGSGAAATADSRPVFLTLGSSSLKLNGSDAALQALPAAIDELKPEDGPLTVLISAKPDVTAQRLTDILVVLQRLPDVRVTVLEAT